MMTKTALNVQTGSYDDEYVIYTFEKRQPGQKNPDRWEKRDSCPVRRDALKQASHLFASGRFLKVEVKHRYFDERVMRPVNETLAVLETSRKTRWRRNAILAFSLLCGVVAFAITYAVAGDVIALLPGL